MTIVSNEEVVSQLRDSYKTETGLDSRSIKFPSQIIVNKESDIITLDLTKGEKSNMQENKAAFEGWALALKTWVYKDYAFRLKWAKPTIHKAEHGHYQRFLYRAYKFVELFDWVKVEAETAKLFNDSELAFINGDKNSKNKYVLNVPTGKAQAGATHLEAQLERIFIYSKELKSILGCDEINQQLPVGLFKNKKIRDNRIFSSGRIDLWGINKMAKTLQIIELKEESNTKIGIISELFFYTMLLEDVLNGVFEFSDAISADRGMVSEIKHPDISVINSWFLAPKLHPLISQKLLNLLNNPKVNERKISFSRIGFKHQLLVSGVSVADVAAC